MVMLFCIVASGSVTNFFPTVVATLGYNNIISLLLTAPPYVLCVITAFLNAWHADPRYIVAMSVNCVTAFIAICAATLLRLILVRLNRKLDQGLRVEGAVNEVDENGIPVEGGRHGFRFRV